MIEKIRLVNWRSHADSTLEFSSGTNVIVGAMGSGKTSVVDALCFGLFGTYPAHNARRVSLEETIRGVPNPASEAEVDIEFGWNEKAYRVHRLIKRKGSSEARVFGDGVLLAGPKPQDVNAAIESVLGMSYELFARAVYAEQNNLDFFLRLSPAERKLRFDELLDLDRFERERAQCGLVARRLEDRAVERERWINEAEKRLRDGDEAALMERVAEMASRLEGMRVRERDVGMEQERLDAAFERGVESERAFSHAQQALAEWSARGESAKKTLARLSASLVPLGESEAIALAGEKRCVEAVASLEAEAKKKGERSLSIAAQKAVLASKRADNAAARERVNALDGHCPTCLQPVDEKSKGHVCDELSLERDALDKELAAVSAAHDRALEESRENERLLAEARRVLEEARAGVARARERARVSAEIVHWEAELSLSQNEWAKASERVRSLSFDPEAFRRLSEERSRLMRDRAGLQKQIEGDERLLASLKEQGGRLQKERSAVVSERARVERNRRDIASLRLLANALASMQGQLRNALLEHLNAAMAEIFPRIYPYGDLSACRLLADEKSYELQVRRLDGSWVRVEGILSGGERASAALAIRLSFSLVLARQLGFVVLDEPTHNLDETAVKKVRDLLAGALPSWVGQVFVITHHAGLEDAATGSLYRVEREKELDGHSWVERLAIDSMTLDEKED